MMSTVLSVLWVAALLTCWESLVVARRHEKAARVYQKYGEEAWDAAEASYERARARYAHVKASRAVPMTGDNT